MPALSSLNRGNSSASTVNPVRLAQYLNHTRSEVNSDFVFVLTLYSGALLLLRSLRDNA